MIKLPSVAVVICAAGASSRFCKTGRKKEYQKLNASSDSLTVLGSAVSIFAKVPSVEVIVIAVNANTESDAREALPQQYLISDKPRIIFVNGGESRRASVYNALSILASFNPSYVLIHDGARPWVKTQLVEEIIKAAEQYGAVIPLLEFTDTPKECSDSLQGSAATFIKTHLKRANTGAAQTPQGFKFPEILHAHEKAAQENEDYTDDAEIWGKFCGKVAVIKGDPENRKVTYEEDIK